MSEPFPIAMVVKFVQLFPKDVWIYVLKNFEFSDNGAELLSLEEQKNGHRK